MKLPKEGDFITIQSYKHDGSLHRTWRDTMVLKITENAIIGVNDHTLVTESPFHIDQEALKYIDYDLDVKVFTNGEKKLLDVEEYEQHKEKMHYSDDIDFILKENVKVLVDWINQNKGPFSEEYIKIWYNRYVELRNK